MVEPTHLKHIRQIGSSPPLLPSGFPGPWQAGISGCSEIHRLNPGPFSVGMFHLPECYVGV